MSINRNLSKFAPKINSSGQAAVAEITVTVVSSGGNKYAMDGTTQQTVSLSKGITYRFDNSDSSNSGHPLAFSTTSNGTHGGGSAFTTGITTVGTAGSTGAYVEVTLEQDAPDHLYYYCTAHSGMGGLAKTAPVGDANFASFANTFTFPTSDGSANQVLQTDGSGALTFGTPSSSYADGDVDTHLNRSSATGGDYLYYNGNDYSWQSALNELSDDTTPSLGGDLDVVTRSIVSTSNRNINITPNGSGKVVLDGISHPNADGNSGQVLTTDGSGNLSFASVGSLAGSGIQNVSDDSSPQLGGSLDVVTHSIVSTSNRNINITPDGSGAVVIDGLSFPTSDGTADQVLKTDGSGNLSFTTVSSGGSSGGSLTATATGALSDGSLVVVNADGTVSNVLFAEDASIGSATLFDGSNVTSTEAVYDANSQKVVIAYRDVGNTNGEAVVGTVSGNSISFGSVVTFNGSTASEISLAYDSTNNKVVIVYRDDGASGYGKAIVGTVSGTSISFGSAATFRSAGIEETSIAYDANAQKFLIAYRDDGNNQHGTAVVGTVSGTSISFGSASVYNAAGTNSNAVVYDANAQKLVIGYVDSADQYGKCVVATISGTSVTFGSEATFENSGTGYISGVYDASAQKVVFAYQNGSDSSKGKAAVGTVSGTSISFGTPVNFEENGIFYTAIAYDSNAQKVVIAYRDQGNSNYGEVISGTVSGTSITFDSSTVFESGNIGHVGMAFDASQNKIVIPFRDSGDSSKGKAVVFTPSSTSFILTTENFIGISDGAYSNGATATIQTAGSVDDAQSGLTAGQSYYIQSDGTLGLSPDTIEVLAGTAVSATEILINPDTDPAIFGTSQVDAHLNLSSATSGQILSYNGSDYAWTNDSTSPSLNATAAGTLANGDMVIVNADGTVSAIGTQSVSAASGSAVEFNDTLTYSIASAFDTNTGKVVVAYEDYSDNHAGKVVVGTISGTSVTFGTEVEFAAAVENVSIVYHKAAQKMVIVYADEGNSDKCTAIVGTVSGTSMTFGSENNFGNPCHRTAISYDDNAEKVVVAYRQHNNNGEAAVGTVSGTSITFGSISTFHNSSTSYPAIAYDQNAQKHVVAYVDYDDPSGFDYGRARVATVSGTSVSFGTEVGFSVGSASWIALGYDEAAQKMLICFVGYNYGITSSVRVGTISGTDITFGAHTDAVAGWRDPDIIYDSNLQKCIISGRNDRNSTYAGYHAATISGTSVTMDSVTYVFSNNTSANSLAYDSANGSFLASFTDINNSQVAKAVAFNTAYSITRSLTSENFIGVSNNAYTDGQTATIQVLGAIDDAQSGLTAGQKYFVQSDGSLGLSPDTIPVAAGTAVSATQLLISPEFDAEDKTSPSTQLVANGALSNGTKVCVNADGTVSAIAETSVTASTGSATTWANVNSTYNQGAYDSYNKKVVFVYVDGTNSDYGKAVVGTVSGSSITFGTPVTFNSATTSNTKIIYDENAQKLVVLFDTGHSTYNAKAIVGTVSGTSISFGSAVTFHAASTSHMNGMYDPDAQKIIVGYKKNSNNNGVIIVGTVSGTSISFGSENVFDDNAREISIGYDQNTQKHLIVYADNGNSLFGTAKVGTLSGTSMSFGSATVFESAQMSNPSTVYEPTAQKLVINYTDYGNSGTGTSVVATISGTSVTFGSAATFNTGGTYRISAVYHAAAAKIVIAFQDGGNSSNPTIVEGTVSGTSISFANETSLASVTGNYVSQVYDSTNKVSVVGYYDGSNSGYGTAVVRLTSYLDQNLTATNYIGISDAAYSDGATATIQVAGAVDDAQSGLTAGQLYYVQNDGTLSTTADSPSVIAGTAISATKLIVKG